MKLEFFYQASSRFRTAIAPVSTVVSSHVVQAIRSFPEGWSADAHRRSLFVPSLLGAGIGAYFAWPVEPPPTTLMVMLNLPSWPMARRGAVTAS